MAVAMSAEQTSVSLQKGLSEWWSEETEYVFQRIERWAAFARGYNRLRSQRLSRGRLTMQEEREPRWSVSSNKIVIEDPTWSPRFHNLKRSHRRKSRTDENCKINCCGTLDYRSNGNLDSTCLETYRYDHSIYFKTIGDIKSSNSSSSKKDPNAGKSEVDDASCFGDEQLEWEIKSAPGFVDDPNFQDDDDNDDNRIDEIANENCNLCLRVPEFGMNICDVDVREDQVTESVVGNVWPIVDLTKLSLGAASSDNNQLANAHHHHLHHHRLNGKAQDDFNVGDMTNDNDDNNNNNHYIVYNEESSDSARKMIELQLAELTDNRKGRSSTINSLSPLKNNQEGTARMLGFRKQGRSPRRVRQPTVIGENNVTWPGVLLNYTKNVDPVNSPHHRHHAASVHVK